MQRDMDVVRRIVLALRDVDHPVDRLDGIDQEAYLMHAELLIEANLAQGTAVRTMDNRKSWPSQVMLTRLTWAGHDFADSVVEDTIWKKAKENVLKPAGSWTFGLLTEYLKAELKMRLGLP